LEDEEPSAVQEASVAPLPTLPVVSVLQAMPVISNQNKQQSGSGNRQGSHKKKHQRKNRHGSRNRSN